MRDNDFWTIIAILSLIFCFGFGIYLLAKMVWLVVVKYPKEKREEEALNNALNQIRQR